MRKQAFIITRDVVFQASHTRDDILGSQRRAAIMARTPLWRDSSPHPRASRRHVHGLRVSFRTMVRTRGREGARTRDPCLHCAFSCKGGAAPRLAIINGCDSRAQAVFVQPPPLSTPQARTKHSGGSKASREKRLARFPPTLKVDRRSKKELRRLRALPPPPSNVKAAVHAAVRRAIDDGVECLFCLQPLASGISGTLAVTACPLHHVLDCVADMVRRAAEGRACVCGQCGTVQKLPFRVRFP